MNTQSKTGTSKDEPIPGLRDFFASSALSILASYINYNPGEPTMISRYCYEVADAMLKERERTSVK